LNACFVKRDATVVSATVFLTGDNELTQRHTMSADAAPLYMAGFSAVMKKAEEN
jgi:hypothetical protein